jgi:flagellar protein FlaI
MARKPSSKKKGNKKSFFGFGASKQQAVKKKIAKMEQIQKEVVSPLGPDEKEIEFIAVQEPFLYAHVTLNTKTSDYGYNVVEPTLTPREEETLQYLIDTLSMILKYDLEKIEDTESKKTYIEETVRNIYKDYNLKLTTSSKKKILYYILRDFVGYGKMDPLMHDLAVEDISCDGTAIPLYIYHKEYGSIRTNIIFESDEEVEGYVVSLAQKCNKIISVADPILDATLPDGSRLNATLGREVTTRGSSFSIRKFREDPITITDLVNWNTCSPEMAAHIWMAVHYGESIIFAGGTASGKTATMNASSIFIPPSVKIISIEDTREVNLPHQNWIAGITRETGDEDSAGNITMFKLLKAALRQRPEYILVGEVRGEETMTMFQAMATGHITYSTMHADSVSSIVYRLENPPINIPRVLLTALNMVVIHGQMRLKGKMVRRIVEITEIIGIEPTTLEVITNKAYIWNPSTDTFTYGGHSNLYEKYMDRDDSTYEEVMAELNRRADVVRWMCSHNVRNLTYVADIVAQYYEDPEKVQDILSKAESMDDWFLLTKPDEQKKKKRGVA